MGTIVRIFYLKWKPYKKSIHVGKYIIQIYMDPKRLMCFLLDCNVKTSVFGASLKAIRWYLRGLSSTTWFFADIWSSSRTPLWPSPFTISSFILRNAHRHDILDEVFQAKQSVLWCIYLQPPGRLRASDEVSPISSNFPSGTWMEFDHTLWFAGVFLNDFFRKTLLWDVSCRMPSQI